MKADLDHLIRPQCIAYNLNGPVVSYNISTTIYTNQKLLAFIQSASYVAAGSCIKSGRYRSRATDHVYIKQWNGEKCDLRGCGMTVSVRRAGLIISETADLLGFSHTIAYRAVEVEVGVGSGAGL